MCGKIWAVTFPAGQTICPDCFDPNQALSKAELDKLKYKNVSFKGVTWFRLL